MFKNILNNNNKNGASNKQQETKQQKSSIMAGAQRTFSNDSLDGSMKSSSSKSTISAVRRGRKKFSSMMNKLQKSGRKFTSFKGNSKDACKNGDKQHDITFASDKKINHKCLPYEFDDDDDIDDDAYKSAEETVSGCDEMGACDECDVDDKSKNFNKIDHEQTVSVTTKKKYCYDSGDKFLLPEEQCDIPTFLHTETCDEYLIEETRRLLKERFAKNPDSFYENDYKRMLSDDWTVTRFLLRRRLDPKRTAKLMEECGRFRKQYKMSEVELWEFPIEFHKAGGLFKYAPDRVGNITMYMRVKMYRRVPEISDVFKAFILCVLEQCDVANNGRGTAVIFDLSGCGLQNVDLGFLSWLLSSFRNYCPKGVSYILVYNLPWILNATCKLAMTWMSASNRRALRFVYGDEIENFIRRENLPDYLGGTCKLDYRRVPDGSKPAIDVCDRLDMTKEQALKIRELFKEYLSDDQDQFSEKTAFNQKQPIDTRSHYDDAKSNIIDNNNYSEQHQSPLSDGDQAQTNGTNSEQVNGAGGNNRIPVVGLVSQASRFIAQ